MFLKFMNWYFLFDETLWFVWLSFVPPPPTENHFGTSEISVLCHNWPKSIITVDLSHNRIDDTCCEELSRLFADNPRILHVRLRGEEVWITGRLEDILPFHLKRLNHVRIPGNVITANGLSSLLESLRSRTCLLNQIDIEGSRCWNLLRTVVQNFQFSRFFALQKNLRYLF